MQIRFVRTVDSETPGFPFRAGQVIAVSALSDRVRQYLREGAAVLVHEAPERAVLSTPERGITNRAKRRQRDEVRA